LQSISDASQTASGTSAKTNPSRKTELQQLYLTHYSTLTATAYEAHSELLVFDAYRVMELLSAKLNRYTGPSSDEPFLKWATRFVRKESERYKITATILSKYRRVIDSAIWKYRQTAAAFELYIEHEDVFQEIAALIFEKAHSLNKKGRAKLSTRLTALVKKHCYFYHVSKFNRRHSILTAVAPTDFGIEIMTKQELESQRFDDEESERASRYDGS